MSTKKRALHQWIVVGALTAPLLAFSQATQAQGDFSGGWRSNNGEMRIEQSGSRAWGEYAMKDGRIRGDVDGDTFSGIWTQTSSNRGCPDERMGSRYWGRVTLHLNEEGDRFYGRWSYCDDAPGSAGEWHGERHRHLHD